jgi:bifunctional enzyme CysN/CysC
MQELQIGGTGRVALAERAGAARDLLRFLTCGSVDDGKSTLIGRLLFDTHLILEDQLASLKTDSLKHGTVGNDVDLALLCDGLEAEREQGITIDVAYRFFTTAKRTFIVADAPGHEQYTRNMATGASNSDLAVLLVDARKGIVTQTRRHSHICALLGIHTLVLAVNKIDLVDFSKTAFERIAESYRNFACELAFSEVFAVPISARFGDNVSRKSERLAWYRGPTLLDYLEQVDVQKRLEARPFRFAVQWVNRPDHDFRGVSGMIGAGTLRVDDPIVHALTGQTSRVTRIYTADGDLAEAKAGDSVTLCLADDLDVGRGNLLSKPDERPRVADQFAAHLLWLGNEPLLPGRSYLLRIGAHWVPASVSAIKHKIEVNSGAHLAGRTLELNEIAFCNISTTAPIAFDPYEEDRNTGAFILVDRNSNETVAAGMIAFELRRSSNIHRERLFLDKSGRAATLHQKPAILWLTGLSGAGKSTIAREIEKELHQAGCHSYMLDGDNVRHGLNKDLGFTDADRVENVRRVGEVAKLFVDAGLIVICSFISPFRAERQMVRDLVEGGEFIEIFVDTPLAECMRRDPKGLYAKVSAGQMKNFTGVDSPYEPPQTPEVRADTMTKSAAGIARDIVEFLRSTGRIN